MYFCKAYPELYSNREKHAGVLFNPYSTTTTTKIPLSVLAFEILTLCTSVLEILFCFAESKMFSPCGGKTLMYNVYI